MTTNTRESTYKPGNYGNRSNISEINEADFSTNLRSDQSVSSPRTGALPSINNQQMLQSEHAPHGASAHNYYYD